jgi:hypothetical protein
MQSISKFAGLAVAVPLMACATAQPARIQAIKSSNIQNVVDDMKRQVSVYVAYQNSPQGTRSVINASAAKACGNGLIDFDIKSVKLEVLTTLESSVEGGVDVGPVVSASGRLGAGRSVSNTQELIFGADMLPNRSFVYVGNESVGSAPIAGTLINLRNALIKSGEVRNRVCFKTTSDTSDGNTYKIALSIEDHGGGKIGLGLAPLAFDVSGETKSTTGNTLIVTFEPHEFTRAEIANVRQHGGRGKIDVGNSGIWSTPLAPKGNRGAGNNCPAGTVDPSCQGTFNQKSAGR